MKYILGALGVIFLVILVVVLITRGGGDNGPADRPMVVSEQAKEGVSAVYTVEGRVTGEERRRAIRIIVSNDERRLEILSGYGEAIERSHTYPNTQAGFETFLAALDQAGFENKKDSAVDPRGACPIGRRMHFELNEFSQPLLETWTTSCSTSIGTFAGRLSTVRQLFEGQIPDFKKQTAKVDLTGNREPKEGN